MKSTVSHIEPLESRIAPAGFIFASGGGIVEVFADPSNHGTHDTMTDSFAPFLNYTGPISIATGDFNGDGNDELVVAKAVGKGKVKIWEITSGGNIGSRLDSFIAFTAPNSGASVAAGDLNNDGRAELIVGAGPGGAPTVKIYSDTNNDGAVSDNMTDSFLAFDAAFTGGVKVASGDTTNSGGAELIAGMWSGGGLVRVFSDANANLKISDEPAGGKVEEFAPFGATYAGGVSVAAGPIANAGGTGAELMVGKSSGTPKVLIFTDANANGKVFDEPVFDTLRPGGTGGANVAAGDTDNSGALVEVIVAPASGAGSHFKVFDDNADTGVLLSDNPTAFEADAFSAGYSGGVNVAFGKVNTQVATLGGGLRTITDNGATLLSIFVPSGAGIIRDLDVSLSLVHTFNSDLGVTLTHVASGKSVTLFNHIGGNGDGFIVRLNDSASTDIGTATGTDGAALSGVFRPQGTAVLSTFNGLDASGEWRLTIVDNKTGDTGTLFDWSLFFTM